jgi:hypothetical protein
MLLTFVEEDARPEWRDEPKPAIERSKKTEPGG